MRNSSDSSPTHRENPYPASQPARGLHRFGWSFRLAALVGADLGRGGRHPALALARVLAHTPIARGLARTLALAAIAADTLHVGSVRGTARGALRKDRRSQKHRADRRRQNRTCN